VISILLLDDHATGRGPGLGPGFERPHIHRGLAHPGDLGALVIAVLIGRVTEAAGIAAILDDAGRQVIAVPLDVRTVAVGHVAVGVIGIGPGIDAGDAGHGVRTAAGKL